jgi:hypothetical protein
MPSGHLDEREMLIAYLDQQRESVIPKLDGLTEDQLRWKQSPEGIPLLNLVAHLAGVERRWSIRVISGQVDPTERDAERDDEFGDLPGLDVATAVEDYRAAYRHTNDVIRGVSLDDACAGETGYSVRWVVLHLIEETARHAGHADITRELIDGSVGL